MKTLITSFAIAAMLLAVPVFAADNAKGALDGKSYAVVVKSVDGKTTKDDTITFNGGKVEWALSKADGFAPAAYATKIEGAQTHVTAELKNDKGETRKLVAMINGDKMTGSIEAKEADSLKVSRMTIAPKLAKTAAATPAPVAPVAPTHN